MIMEDVTVPARVHKVQGLESSAGVTFPNPQRMRACAYAHRPGIVRETPRYASEQGLKSHARHSYTSALAGEYDEAKQHVPCTENKRRKLSSVQSRGRFLM